MKNFNKIATIIFSLGVFFIVMGTSYAFFLYNKSGLYAYSIKGGKMGIVYNETTGNNIALNNIYPLTDKMALTKALTFSFTITGYNESDKNVYYAIEMDHGANEDGMTRFLDTDIKLSLYENDSLVIRNKIFNNLDNKNIFYGYIEKETSKTTPTVKNYTVRLWINDNVVITNTPNYFDVDDKHVYSTDEYANCYANFKVNVIANVTGEGIGEMFYDANGGNYTPKPTSLLTNKITTQKPVKDGKAFLGWSEDENATIPTYKSGDYYGGETKFLYAVYGDTRNVMTTFPSTITNQKANITEVYFINDMQEDIDTRYNAATIKADLTYNKQGSVKGWLEVDENNNGKYILYVGSEGTTYLRGYTALFYCWENVESIDLTNIDTSNVAGMDHMFFWCSALKSLDLSGFNTSKVTSMGFTFANCSSLINLDVSSFDTSNVTYMCSMFQSCNSLTALNVNNFNTSSVKIISSMFESCSSLTSLDISGFDISKVTDIGGMFAYCSSLISLDVSSFDTSSVTYMNNMFQSCRSLTSLDISDFDTSNVTDMSWMFNDSINLTSINVSSFDTRNVIYMNNMFECCFALRIIDLSNFDTKNVIDMHSMFDTCSSLVSVDLSSFDISRQVDVSGMFIQCSLSTKVYVKTIDVQTLILDYAPSQWTESNVIVKSA